MEMEKSKNTTTFVDLEEMESPTELTPSPSPDNDVGANPKSATEPSAAGTRAPETRIERGKRKGYAGVSIKIWEVSSHSSFLLGATCYIVNGVYWLYFRYEYDDFKKHTTTTTTTLPTLALSNASSINTTSTVAHVIAYDAYYNYNYVQYLEINASAQWWEVAGALFYIINPLLEFGTGALKTICAKKCKTEKGFGNKFFSLPWTPIAAILFLIGSILYLINVFAAMVTQDYDEHFYTAVDLCAALVFFADAIAYLLSRLGRKRKEIGAGDETSFLCCGRGYRGCAHVDWGFWGDMFFIIGCLVELVDHFYFTAELNMVACVLWWLDAVLYTVEWVLIHKLSVGRLKRAQANTSGQRMAVTFTDLAGGDGGQRGQELKKMNEDP